MLQNEVISASHPPPLLTGEKEPICAAMEENIADTQSLVMFPDQETLAGYHMSALTQFPDRLGNPRPVPPPCKRALRKVFASGIFHLTRLVPQATIGLC